MKKKVSYLVLALVLVGCSEKSESNISPKPEKKEPVSQTVQISPQAASSESSDAVVEKVMSEQGDVVEVAASSPDLDPLDMVVKVISVDDVPEVTTDMEAFSLNHLQKDIVQIAENLIIPPAVEDSEDSEDSEESKDSDDQESLEEMEEETVEEMAETTETENMPEISLKEQELFYSGYEFQTGSSMQCRKVYPNMQAVSLPVLQKIFSLNPSEVQNKIAADVLKHARIMFTNMMSDPERPVHPLAFMAMVKHFESSDHIQEWGVHDFRFFSPHCNSGTCSGYFQVDVKLERDWSLEGVCGVQGLDVLGMTGGPDVCSFLYWWLHAGGKSKCKKLVRGYANPCRDKGYIWDVTVFERAYLAYGQLNQWRHHGIYDSWGRAYSGGWVGDSYFRGYENCAAVYHQDEAAPASLVRRSVAVFAKNIGIIPAWLTRVNEN